MSVNSLANFGTPGINGDRSAVIQPILTTHWRILVHNFGSSTEASPYDLTRQVKSVSLPSVSFSITPIYSYVSVVYIQTRGEWGDGSMRFVDDITNSVRRRIENQIAKQKNFYDQTMSRAGENYKFEMDVDILAGGASAGNTAADPNVIRKYCYAGCTLSGADDGEMNYDNAAPKEIGVSFKYDNVVTFDQNGSRLGTFSHTDEINAQSGSLSTGAGIAGSQGTTSGFAINGSIGASLTF